MLPIFAVMVCFMASTAPRLACDLVGARKGRAGWFDRPYSRTFATKALLRPSVRFSAKPTLMSWPPRLSVLTGVVPRADISCPVDRDGRVVPHPIAPAKFDRNLGSTTAAPALRASSANASILLSAVFNASRNAVGSWIVALAMDPSFRGFVVGEDLHVAARQHLNRINQEPAQVAVDFYRCGHLHAGEGADAK